MADNTKQPNIIYILGDDHRQDFSELGGFPFIMTPNLKKLSEEGHYFENSFCTSPCCTPSRACHYTGLWERAHGINFNSETAISRNAWQETFPMILKKNGYQTAWIGKNHVPVAEHGYKTGYMETTFDYWYGNHGHSFFYPKEKERGKIYSNAKYDTQVEVFEEGAMNFLDPQKDFIESCSYPLTYRDKTKPFCMCVTFNLPHGQGTGTMEQRPSDDEIYKSLYRDKMDKFPIPKTYIAHDDIKEPRLPKWLYSGEYIDSYNYVKTIPDLKERMVRICQTVTGMDRMVGHLREKLTELGLADNTIIVFSTDHGIHHGEHGLGGKCFLYEEDIRIPLIVYDPREDKKTCGKKITELVGVPDLAPTVLELAGVKIPEVMQGTSLVPLMHSQNVKWRDEILLEQLMDNQNYCKSEAVCTKEWKYIRYFERIEIPGNDQRIRCTNENYTEFLMNSYKPDYKKVAYEELYHLSEDKYEEVNLATDSKYKNILEYYRKRIVEMIKEKIIPDHESRVCMGACQIRDRDITKRFFK